MAVTSIWRVKGWLGKVVIYIENPEKTTNPEFYKSDAITDRQCQGLEDVISYAVNSNKTQQATEDADIMERYVSGVNCHPSTAREEMLAVKKHFGKEDGTIAYHGYQSFAPGEATPELAHKIGVELAQRLWGERYQVVVATHLDKANHLHNHFVLNTVSHIDGIKYHRTERDYHDMQKISDELCREYGFSIIEDPQPGKSKQYGEWRAEQEQRPTWRGIIRSDVDDALRQSMTERQFFENLHRKGYEVKVGKDISVRPPGKPRFVRLARNFGDDYTLEGIRRRILEQSRATRPLPEPAPKRKQYRVSGNWKNRKKVTGFRALYFHYCYLLGVFPKEKQQNRKRLHFLLREDLIKLETITQEARLLGTHHIDTAQQLSSYVETSTGLSNDKKYIVRVGNEKIATFTLVNHNQSASQTEIADWQLGILEFFVRYNESYYIKKLDGHTAYVNDSPLDDSFTIRISTTNAEGYLPEGVTGIRVCTQQITGLAGKPNVRIVDAAGNEMEVVYDESTHTFTEQSEVNSISDTEKDLAINAVKTYALYMIKRAGEGDIAEYFLRGSDAYNAITDTERGFVQDAASREFVNETVTNYCRYSESLFSVRVSVTLNQYRSSGTVKESIIEQSLFFEKRSNGKWMCYNMTAVDVSKPVERVRLTFMNDDVVLDSDFYDSEINSLTCPAVSAPEGKIFSGWMVEGTDEKGQTVMNLVFQPNENSVVNLPANGSLEPMTLYPYFEDAA